MHTVSSKCVKLKIQFSIFCTQAPSYCLYMYMIEFLHPSTHPTIDSNCEGWRCPSCRNLSKFVPTIYRCYCGKCVNPRRRSKGELTVPHSCGELCKKKLGMTPKSNCRYAHYYCNSKKSFGMKCYTVTNQGSLQMP